LDGNPIDHAAIELERDHPAWQVWVTYRPVAVPTWNARRWDGTRMLQAGSAERLAEALERAEAEPTG
jgi:hypothetical protein